jgi:hypothetical protein
LLIDDALDFVIFDLGQGGLVDLAGGEVCSGLVQPGGPQQAADLVVTVRINGFR